MSDFEKYLTLEYDEGEVECEILGVFDCDGKDYIALAEMDESGELTGDVFLFGYEEHDEDFELVDIVDEAEYQRAVKQFDELMAEDIDAE